MSDKSEMSLAEMARQEAATTPEEMRRLVIADGRLSLNTGVPMEQDKAVIVIEAWTHSRSYYKRAYVGGETPSPDCHAYGRITGDMRPPPYCIQSNGYDRQNNECVTCTHSQWGTSNNRIGQACRLSVVASCRLVGCVSDQELVCLTDWGALSQAPRYFLRLSPTMLKGFYAHVRLVAEGMKRPLSGVSTLLTVRPHVKNKSECLWSVHEQLPESVVRQTLLTAEEQKTLLEHRPSAPGCAQPDMGVVEHRT